MEVRPAGRLLAFLLSALALTWVLVVVSPQVFRPLMLFVAVLAAIILRPTPSRAGIAFDVLLCAVAVAGLGWPLLAGEPFLYRAAAPTSTDLICGVLAIVAVLDAVRRTTGWMLPVAAVVFLAYALAGPSLGAIGLAGIAHRGYDLPRLIGNLYMTLEGIYGPPLDVAVTYIVLFCVYGAVLEATGAGRFFLAFAMRAAAGSDARRSAGRGVALAGFLLGTVSGSGVATTVTLGSVAWPVLKRVGYRAETAAGMLAASGIGALLSPPTMGAAAFLLAEYLRISYLQVLVMATIPTALYYLSILLMIEGDGPPERAGRGTDPPRTGASPEGPGLTREVPGLTPERPGLTLEGSAPATSLLRSIVFFSSLVLVALLMAWGLSPFRAVFWAVVAAVALSWLHREDRMTPGPIARALTAGGEDAMPVIGTTAVAGIIVGVVTLTGLGLKAAGLIVGLAGGSALLTVLYGAVAVWLLGLAVPVTASYIISAVMVVPALTAVGVAPVAAHMFIFYYAVLSEVSPPTALAPFAAAALTGASSFRTMIVTWKYALPAFVVPLAFTVDARGLGLLLQAPVGDIVWATSSAVAGTCAFAAACSGWGLRRPAVSARVAAAVAGALLIYPAPVFDAAGLAIGAVAVWLGRRGGRR